MQRRYSSQYSVGWSCMGAASCWGFRLRPTSLPGCHCQQLCLLARISRIQAERTNEGEHYLLLATPPRDVSHDFCVGGRFVASQSVVKKPEVGVGRGSTSWIDAKGLNAPASQHSGQRNREKNVCSLGLSVRQEFV